ncbi:hypothetical protein N185_16090 [Sinorhizobium sp. GW3]|nr:hypothetical protein N185_16090 [Sinorhizobium sp. GW3]
MPALANMVQLGVRSDEGLRHSLPEEALHDHEALFDLRSMDRLQMLAQAPTRR